MLRVWVLRAKRDKAPAEWTLGAHGHRQTMKHSAQKHFNRQKWGWGGGGGGRHTEIKEGGNDDPMSDGSSLGPFWTCRITYFMCLSIIKMIIINTSRSTTTHVLLGGAQYKPHPLRLFAIMMSVTASNTTWMFPVSVAQVR